MQSHLEKVGLYDDPITEAELIVRRVRLQSEAIRVFASVAQSCAITVQVVEGCAETLVEPSAVLTTEQDTPIIVIRSESPVFIPKAQAPRKEYQKPKTKTLRKAAVYTAEAEAKPAGYEPSAKAGSGIDTVKLYLQDIGRHPLLTKEDEVRLAQLIEQGEAAKLELETPEVQNNLALRIQHQRSARRGDEARRSFINSNLRLTVSIAKIYQGQGLDLIDLIQEGNFGLMHAVEKFEWRKGFKFSTYATWWIRQAITRGIAHDSRLIRLPMQAGYIGKSIAKLRAKDRDRVELQGGDCATDSELADLLDLSVEKLQYYEDAYKRSTSIKYLDRKIGEDSDKTLGDFTEDPKSYDDYSEVERDIVTGGLKKAVMDVLSNEREYRIIVMRFGLDGKERMKREDVGKEFNISRERVRQIEAIALSKLRHPASSRSLAQFKGIF